MNLYNQTVLDCSKLITQRYSTSFSLGIRTLHRDYHAPIYAIYGFVRLADEIVDTFHQFDKADLLARFITDTWQAIAEGVSLNPVLHAFQLTVNRYSIDHDLIEAFLHSMEMDLHKQAYQAEEYERYIYGSAEVVGLMCLHVFCQGDKQQYQQLREPARRLGAAFQKVNFLRDIKSDFDERGRVYFPDTDFENFTPQAKAQIEADIAADFEAALHGIKQLPQGARQGVYLAYCYYLQLFSRIRQASPSRVKTMRIRVPDSVKMLLLAKTWVEGRLNVL